MLLGISSPKTLLGNTTHRGNRHSVGGTNEIQFMDRSFAWWYIYIIEKGHGQLSRLERYEHLDARLDNRRPGNRRLSRAPHQIAHVRAKLIRETIQFQYVLLRPQSTLIEQRTSSSHSLQPRPWFPEARVAWRGKLGGRRESLSMGDSKLRSTLLRAFPICLHHHTNHQEERFLWNAIQGPCYTAL